MSKIKRKFKKTNKFGRTVYILLNLAYLISFIFFAKSVISLSGIETVIRYILLVIFVVYFLFYLYIGLLKLLTKKYVIFYLMSFLTFILVGIFIIGALFIDTIFERLGSINEKDSVSYTSYLISMSDTEFDKNSTIGMISDEDDIEGYIIANDILEEEKLKNDITDYDNYIDMLYDLYEGNIDAIFVSGNYVTLFSGEDYFGNISTDTKIIYKKSKKMANEDTSLVSNKSLEEPFTVLLLGVDSESDGLDANAAFNGDTLILVTFNPDTLSATIFSIPRDSYVPIACRNNAYAKINSSAAYGTSCVIDTIKNLTDIDIDYYAKINFKGVVDLVEAVGGIDVYVEEPDYQWNHGFDCGDKVCEQNSNRDWGNALYISPGLQHLNGEEALAYARNRGQYISSDLARNAHQQDVITALAKQMMQIKSYNEFKKILDSISNNISTNMSTSQILSSYQILKDMATNALNGDDFIHIQKLALNTYSLPVYLASSDRITSALGYYEDSLESISKEMKYNLEILDPEDIKTFSFSIDEEYTGEVIGKYVTGGASTSVLSSFVGKTKSEAESYCSSNNYSCKFTYVDENSQYYNSDIATDLIASQNPRQGTLSKNVSSITFYINGASAEE